MDGVTTHVGHRVPERGREHVGRGLVGDVIEHGETARPKERIRVRQRGFLQCAQRRIAPAVSGRVVEPAELVVGSLEVPSAHS
jgi:hypothetical protein